MYGTLNLLPEQILFLFRLNKFASSSLAFFHNAVIQNASVANTHKDIVQIRYLRELTALHISLPYNPLNKPGHSNSLKHRRRRVNG